MRVNGHSLGLVKLYDRHDHRTQFSFFRTKSNHNTSRPIDETTCKIVDQEHHLRTHLMMNWDIMCFTLCFSITVIDYENHLCVKP